MFVENIYVLVSQNDTFVNPTSFPTQMPSRYINDYPNMSTSFYMYLNDLQTYNTQYDLVFNMYSFKDVILEGSCRGDHFNDHYNFYIAII